MVRVIGSAGRGEHGIALLAFALGLCAAACGEHAAAPAPVSTGNGASDEPRDGGHDAGVVRDGGQLDAGGSKHKDGGGREFGFGGLGIDASAARDARVAVDAGSGPAPTFERPEGWHCSAVFAADSICDCGCGAPDQACKVRGCAAPGCAAPACQVCFGADGAERDCAAPGAWNCELSRRGDGVCDCGCGALDPDCGKGGCYPSGCNVDGCEQCHDADGAHACGEPPQFRCDKSVRGDGACDCGCGNLDPDCKASACTAADCTALGCDVCHDATGKAVACKTTESKFSCDSTLKSDKVCDCGCGEADPDCAGREACVQAGCDAPDCQQCHDAFGRMRPCPTAWTCSASRFADGRACDCGCGRSDPDCGGDGCAEAGCKADGCDVRHVAGGAPIPPSDWTCADAAYGRGDGCDCGCGADDPDCEAGCSEPGCRADSCDRCRLNDGKTMFDCQWRCDPSHFGSGDGCDCGCGMPDPDCAKGGGCEEGGCFAGACQRCSDSRGKEYACARTACRSGFQNDGVCDCGCREADPDCAKVKACVEPGCSEDGCGRCHEASGSRVSCGDWQCDLEQQGGGDGCNCGCGAPDSDCKSGEGCAGPGCRQLGCITCRSADGAPMSCAP